MIEVIKIEDKYFISYLNGREKVNLSPKEWSKKVQDNGAGEIILTSVNNEGLKNGYDIELNEQISKIVKIPLIAHGGAGSFKNILEVIKNTNVDGVMIASIFHYHYLNIVPPIKKLSIGNSEFLNNFKKKKVRVSYIKKLKKFLKKNKINVRI